MSLGPVLDVAIGLVFTYLLMGLLVSGMQEVIAGFFQRRGKYLRDGIAHLLTSFDAGGQRDESLFRSVFGHALIGLGPSTLPSYVPSRNFGLALLDALSDGSQATIFSQVEGTVATMPPGPAKDSLTTFLKHAGGDLDLLRKSIETWFDDAMDRVSGSYKRWTQCWAVVLGLVIAVGFNVDSIAIARSLWTDPAKRAAVVAMAGTYVEKNPTGPGSESVDEVLKRVDALPVPVGWDEDAVKKTRQAGFGGSVLDFVAAHGSTSIWILVGWLLTGLATSLGAPFWFDVLQRIFNLRNAGAKPERAGGAA